MNHGDQRTHFITTLIRYRLREYVQQTAQAPIVIRMNPMILDIWRAELLVTGKLLPREPLLYFGGAAIISSLDTELMEIE